METFEIAGVEPQFRLNEGQQRAFDSLCNFLSGKQRVFILKGFAGTGKTTMMRFLVDELKSREKPYRLLAPTGRAAKVLSSLSHDNQAANTIHKMIFNLKGLNETNDGNSGVEASGQMYLVFEASKREADAPAMVYIIDEASMIADEEVTEVTQAKFGSGKLLTELLDYDHNPDSKFIFVGDPCQLPPVGQCQSPALSREYFSSHFGIDAKEGKLTQIMRQANGSSLVDVSMRLRSLWKFAPAEESYYGRQKVWSKLPFRGCGDIEFHRSTDEMVELYARQFQSQGPDHSIIICMSNKACLETSQKVRSLLGRRSLSVERGDLLMVVQNNLLVPLANGDMVTVTEVTHETQYVANLLFRKVKVKDVSTGVTHETWLIEDVLTQSAPNLSKQQQSALFRDFIVRMKDKGIDKDSYQFMDEMQSDPFMNALRCNWGYAVTCQKSQGGEWDEVMLATPRNITLNPTKGKYQWLYTALTRARKRVHVADDFFYSY